MPGKPTAAVVEDLDSRRAALAESKHDDMLASRVPRFLAEEARQAAAKACMTVSAWMTQAMLEKIVNDERKAAAYEMLEAARARKPEGISQALHDQMIRDAINEVTNKPVQRRK